MKILKLDKIMRNLTLIGVGAFMATAIALPITTNASDDDDDHSPVTISAATFTLAGSDGYAVFTLVENDGSMVLTLVEETVVQDSDDDDDD